jgi:hypothetical protein
VFNIQLAAQLKIVANKMEFVVEQCIDNVPADQKHLSETDAALMFKKLQDCVQQHLKLIHYAGNLQHVFSAILLGQLLIASLIICFSGFQFLVSS